jgi:preprotein translocase subunit SecA
MKNQKMKNILPNIHAFSFDLQRKSDEELQDLIQKFHKYSDFEALEEKRKAQWFALVQEISYRSLGLRHFDTQLIAGLFLTEGKIVEMKTGEGKTLVSTLPVSYFALAKQGAHVVTVNEYLAERDQKWMGKIYKALGFSSALVKGSNTLVQKKQAYEADITYLTNSELVFDYLRDNSALSLAEVVQRPFSFCLIDEIDSVLIDEARTPLILSEAEAFENPNKFYLAKKLVSSFQKGIHFEVDEKRRDLYLTEIGYQEAKKRLGKTTLYDPEDPWMLEILNALKAFHLFKLNKDYIILKSKISIVDEFTGRIMEDRRWSQGLHEAIEVKENLPLGKKTKTKTSISYQNFFPLYPILAGMTGTAKTTEQEFQDIYQLDVVVIPPHKEMLRKDLPDAVYTSEVQKWKAVLGQSLECYQQGQPILIGTSSIEKSEFLSDLFRLSNIPHQILNAKPENVKRESEIIAQAGKAFAVTIATNMAGRGTDIILGGNPFFQVKEKLVEILSPETMNALKSGEEKKNETLLIQNILQDYAFQSDDLLRDIENLPYSLDECKLSLQNLYQSLSRTILEEWKIQNEKVKKLGGLFVLGTERHETRRIDNQLRGRSGRQGDPGVSRFFVSLEDDLFKVFGGENLRNWVKTLMQGNDSPLESSFLTKSLEKAQQKVESYHYDMRKNLFQYDTLLTIQRNQMMKIRKELLSQKELEELLLRWKEDFLAQKNQKKERKNPRERRQELEEKLTAYLSYYAWKKHLSFIPYEEVWLDVEVRLAEANFYQEGLLPRTRSFESLLLFDNAWTEHLEQMEAIKETISWRSYGQQNPFFEYQQEALNSFQIFFEKIRFSLVYSFGNQRI